MTPKNEDQLQAECYKLARNSFPHLFRNFWMVPNGENRNPIEANKMMAMGLLGGVWDMHCFYRNKFSIIEFKFGSNTLTKDRIVSGKKRYGQLEWGECMAENGADRYIVKSIEEWKEAFQSIFHVQFK